MKLRASFLLKRNKIDKPLARIRQKRKDSIRNERGDISTNNTYTQNHKKLV